MSWCSDENSSLNDMYYASEEFDRDWFNDQDDDFKREYDFKYENYKKALRNLISDRPEPKTIYRRTHGKNWNKRENKRILKNADIAKDMEEVYNKNKASKVGEEIVCPSCKNILIKKSYQQAFCCTKCKDRYWNFVREHSFEYIIRQAEKYLR